MRRDVGAVLVGLGSFLLVIALALPYYVVAQVVKFPLDENQTTILTGTGMSYFSAAKDTEVTGADIRATDTITGDPLAGSSSVAVWEQFSYLYDTTNNQLVQITTRTFAFNRRTAQLVRCRCANVDGNSAVPPTGVAGQVFPFGTQPKTYDIFDTTLNRPEPFSYDGTATVDGVRAFRFVENVPLTRIGYSPLSSTQPEYGTIHRTYWVDPVTGVLLSIDEYQKLFLEDPATGAPTTVLYSGDLQTTPASVSAMVKLDSSGRDTISLLGTVLPITLAIVGALALIAGILLARQPHREVGAAPGSTPASSADAAAAPQHKADDRRRRARWPGTTT
jgi:Porin PorA